MVRKGSSVRVRQRALVVMALTDRWRSQDHARWCADPAKPVERVAVASLWMVATGESLALTSLSSGAGCGCKLAAKDLLPIVMDLPAPTDPRLLVGAPTGDDAAVFALSEDLALVQTIDF